MGPVIDLIRAKARIYMAASNPGLKSGVIQIKE